MALEVIRREPSPGSRGVPVLFVHGMWHGAWCWDEHFLSRFAEHGHRAWALSLRGHGASPTAGALRWQRIRDYVEDVAEVAGSLDRAPVLVGHSMGGFVVQHYLTRHEAPAAVLLASVPPAGALRSSLRFAARYPLAFLRCNLTMSMWPAVADPERARRLLLSPDIPAAEAARHCGRLQDESYLAYLGLALARPRGPLRCGRVLVLGAEEDFLITPAEVRATAARYGADCEVLPGMGHDMMLDSGWQSAADRIISWLEAAPGTEADG